ncbi:MAG TPA: beta-xylosidase [Bryobacteraceae bacterium]|jgi:xylan 1,4-beta-xylosidase|nr:beta-xylosidase [Bryobacteraceae bacterium]
MTQVLARAIYVHRSALFAFLALQPFNGYAQRAVSIRVDSTKHLGSLHAPWAYFGYDEPNSTYTNNGKKLVNELAASSRVPVHIRTHNLLTTGNGTFGLKFGSTNVYTEDPFGRPVYNWTIVDKILDTYLALGAKPLVELGFMPKALSVQPEPYTPTFHNPSDFKNYYLGWSYPPKDYSKWGELVYQLVKHSVNRYGRAEVETWDWEVWNEPNVDYWHGTAQEYDKLYDYSAAAVKRALPATHIGGPASTSPRNKKAAAFLQQFLEHCSSGTNYATRTKGAPLDFVSFHAKGSPDINGGHVRMGLSKELEDADQGFKIVRSFNKFQNLPVILSEADPEGCAACSSKDNPANAYRNGPLYPTYTAMAEKELLDLAEHWRANLQGILTWAFEFEDKDYFAGYRDLATNGIDKPILNFFRMAGMLTGDRISVQSDGAQNLDRLLENGVRDKPVIDGLATRRNNEISLLLWNYLDDDAIGPDANVELTFSDLPANTSRLLLRHFRIDRTHSNAYTLWKEMGSPEAPTGEERERLEAAGQLELFDSPHWINSRNGRASVSFSLPLQAVSLVQLSW